MKVQELSQGRLSYSPHFFNMCTEQTQLNGSSESGSTHVWSTAGSLLNIVEHGEHGNENQIYLEIEKSELRSQDQRQSRVLNSLVLRLTGVVYYK